MIEEYLLKKGVDLAVDLSRKLLKGSKSNLLNQGTDIEEAISYHLKKVKNWSEEISFCDLRKAKLTRNVYIQLDIFLYPRRLKIDSNEIIESLPLDDLFSRNEHKHFILLGQPGAGKTTSMKSICNKLFYDESFYPDLFNSPIIIKFRDLNIESKIKESDQPAAFESVNSLIFKTLFLILGLTIDLDKNLLSSEKENVDKRKWLIEKTVINFLEQLKVLLILDGFDELILHKHREIALSEIRELAANLENSTLIVTSRTGDFAYHIENADHFEICPLNENQITEFSYKWLDDKDKAINFLKDIKKSPFSDTAIRPLNLAHLCAIYERVGKIPEKPKTVYRKIVQLLLEEWDEQRSVKRKSRYGNFEIDRKFEFLCDLAYQLTIRLNKNVFRSIDLSEAYDTIHVNYDLKRNEVKKVVDELETHTGLFVQAGYRSYEFAHKSLQEYLTAEYIVRLPNIPNHKNIIAKLPNELAIAVTISSNPSNYFTELVFNRLCNLSLPGHFYEAFLTRLLQEKPDFNSYDNVIISLITLYSLYIEGSSLTGTVQLKLFYRDNLMSQFEQFVSLLAKRNPKTAIFKYYEKHGDLRKLGDIRVFWLSKKKDMAEYDLPRHLYARSNFLD